MNFRSRLTLLCGGLLVLAGMLVVITGCQIPPIFGNSKPPLGAGFRFSPYGPPENPGPAYWADVGQKMASRFPGAKPQCIWIVSQVNSRATYLTFPITGTYKNIIPFPLDDNEEALTLFDRQGAQVWLQVEPSEASIEDLIHLVLARYGHHPSVIGVGIDLEWYQWRSNFEGKAVTDEEATAWLAAVRSHGDKYRLFLKHWQIEKLPPTAREGILFLDDGQQFASLDEMAADFAAWGKAFAPAPVAFQFGYEADRPWWKEFKDPPTEIGQRLLADIPNTEALFWVDFTVFEVFPPPEKTD